MTFTKGFSFLYKRILASALLILCVGTVIGAQGEDAFFISERVIFSETELLTVDLRIPQVGLGNKNAAKQLNEEGQTQAELFIDEISTSAKKLFGELEDGGSHWFPFVAAGSFRVGYADKNVLSIPIQYYRFSGGAHGMTYQFAYNIDTRTGKVLTLADLFLSNFDYRRFIADEVKRQMGLEPEIYFPENFSNLEITSEQPFYFTAENLVIFFGLYEIAPYSSGIREFPIPFSWVWEGLQPRFFKKQGS